MPAEPKHQMKNSHGYLDYRDSLKTSLESGGRENEALVPLQFDKLIQSKYLSHSNECTEQYSTISVQVSISNKTCSWATDSSEILIE